MMYGIDISLLISPKGYLPYNLKAETSGSRREGKMTMTMEHPKGCSSIHLFIKVSE